jgi:hypothetical protein
MVQEEGAGLWDLKILYNKPNDTSIWIALGEANRHFQQIVRMPLQSCLLFLS